MKRSMLEKIEMLAASYTPEWRFNRENPDMGSAVALLYAKMMEQSVLNYNRVLEQHQKAYLEALGAKPLEPEKASGYMTLQLVNEDMPETVVPKGTGIAAAGEEDIGKSPSLRSAESIVKHYETLEEVYVSAAEVSLMTFAEEPGASWYLHFNLPPKTGLISLLFIIKAWEGGKSRNLCFEYWGNKGWLPLKVEDETEELKHTGILRFGGMPDIEKKIIGQWEGYWLRIIDMKGYPMPDVKPKVFINGVRVLAKEAGKKGNLHPGSGHRLTESIGYVSKINNPDVLYGGRETEQHGASVIRNCARICHQFRGVTSGDFQRLVYEVCPDARKVKCFSGYGEDGNRKAGAVTVVILQENDVEEHHYFYKVQEKVQAYLRERAGGILVQQGSLFVVAPKRVGIHVKASLCVTHHNQLLQAQRQVNQVLSDFLDPVSGGYEGTGWELGTVPEYMQIKHCLQTVPGVCWVKQLWIQYEIEENGGFYEVEESKMRKMPWTLPFSGNHQIDILVAEGIGG